MFNGTEVPPHKYPWMAIIESYTEENLYPLCEGTIISDRTVLTAGKNYTN